MSKAECCSRGLSFSDILVKTSLLSRTHLSGLFVCANRKKRFGNCCYFSSEMRMLNSFVLSAHGEACSDCSRATFTLLGSEISVQSCKHFPSGKTDKRSVLSLLKKRLLLSLPARWSVLSAGLRAHLCQSSAKETKHDWEIYGVQCFSELIFRLEIMLVLIFLDGCFQGTQDGYWYFTCQYFTLFIKSRKHLNIPRL